ncbi:MAG: YbhN family protein [Candidatus Njordarchaeum guaymaensis]
MAEEAPQEKLKSILSRFRVRIFVGLFAFTSILIIYMFVTNVDLIMLFRVLRKQTYYLFLALLLQIMVLMVSGIRFYIIAGALDLHTDQDAILARISGQFISLISPSLAGGQIIRAYYISIKGGNWSLGIGTTIAEIFLDILMANIPAILILLPHILNFEFIFLPIFLMSIWTISVHLLIIILSLFPSTRQKFSRIFDKLHLPVSEKNLHDFSSVFRTIISRKKILLIISILTVSMFILQSSVIYVTSCALDLRPTFIDAIIFNVFALIMGGIPTPGGIIGVEYGLSLIADPTVIVLWRFVSYYFTLLVSGIAFQIFLAKYVGREKKSNLDK